ncbi:transcriptional regulator with XRE-family HTH domain [Microbacterium natoriense]|uniref:Transcriptional regulator with XRE-family HTH domain n=1 Tax=Microbacterium natoriense TaxID=284570 RepID=A0AAW8EUX2_9MICO|nr:helix-turn-helix transcriptional regulator [Microbacterium natoriense]MDQ0647306.1 transcriptional regulator with XRE-family HTH domain [Microbacterium natoriense]
MPASDEILRRLAVHIHRIRLERGVSQENLAHELDMHRAYLGSIERAEQNVTLKTLSQLAERLGVDPADLIRPIG